MLNRAPDGHLIGLRINDEPVWLDGKMSDHRKCIGVLDDQIGFSRTDIAPSRLPLIEYVCFGPCVA